MTTQLSQMVFVFTSFALANGSLFAMDLITCKSFENEHVINSDKKYKPLNHMDALQIRLLAELESANACQTEPVFLYPSEKPTHRVIYYRTASKESQQGILLDTSDLAIFAIDICTIFDQGNQTKIRLAEEIVPPRSEKTSAENQHIVAVKIIQKDANVQILRDFANEKNILQFIGQLRGYFEDKDALYLFNDFVPGENLEALLRNDLDDDEKVNIAMATVLAVHQFHQRKFTLHNDIKSGNIKLSKIGRFYKAGLVDFGLSRRMSAPSRAMSGSSGYRDFNYRLGGKRLPQSIQSDYFSLGIVIFEILAQRKNNYQLYMLRQKIDLNESAMDWDLDPTNLNHAFPDSFEENYSDDHSLRGQLIRLAKRFTGPMHERPTPDELTDWLAKFDIVVTQDDINADELWHAAEVFFASRRQKIISVNTNDTTKEVSSKSRLKTSLKTIPLKGWKTSSGSISLTNSSSGTDGTSGGSTPRNDIAAMKTSTGSVNFAHSSSRSKLTASTGNTNTPKATLEPRDGSLTTKNVSNKSSRQGKAESKSSETSSTASSKVHKNKKKKNKEQR